MSSNNSKPTSQRTSPPTSPTSQAAWRSRSPPLSPLPSLSTTLPGLTAFDRAVHVVNISNTTSQGVNIESTSSSSSSGSSDRVVFPAEEQLLLYGAYKQATKGDVKGLKPTFFDIAARSKWQAWANMRGKTQDEAKEVYVDLVVKSLTKPDNHPDHYLLANEIIQRPPSPPPSLSRAASPTANLDKDLPPIQFDSAATTTIASSSSAKDTPHPYQQHQRKGSVSHSIRSVTTGGIHSAAASVYELASEQPFDTDVDTTTTTATSTTTASKSATEPTYHEITETLVEEEILDDDEYANEIQKVTMAASPTSSHTLPNLTSQQQQQQLQGKDDADADDEEKEEEEDDVYQSSEEYDDDESDRSSLGSARSSTDIQPTAAPTMTLQQQGKEGDFVDEGVFDEEEKDELDTDIQYSPRFKLGDYAPVSDIAVVGGKNTAPMSPLSSGIQYVSAGHDKGLEASPVVEPYRVNVVHETTIASPPVTTTVDNSLPAAPTAIVASPHAHAGAGEEAVCPVSKKTASSGGVCPAAMFAQARAAAAAASPKTDEGTSERQQSAQSSPGPITSSSIITTAVPLESSAQHLRAMTEPVSSTPSPSSTPASAVAAATNQGKRIGQGIVSRFTALRTSLAAASARAASSALSGGSSSSVAAVTKNKNAVVVKDPITNQSVTIVCPHLETTQVLETEVVRLQTEISVLHERLDLLQESLKIKSQTRAQERRSARGILKLVLRQGLINAVLLLLVFAVLYKRKSPIAFAILAYVGQGAKEGEAGWRAFLRWSGEVVRQGQRKREVVLRAGRRNGYW